MKENQSIEEIVLGVLRDGSLSIEELISRVGKKRDGATRQGIYRVMRVLKSREIITVHSKTVSLSAIWIDKMQNYFALASHFYANPNSDSSFLNLREGEKKVYAFRSIIELDIFWSHALYLFLEILKNNDPVYVYNPHDWASVARKDNDKTLIEKSFSKNHQIFITVGIASALAKISKRNFPNYQGQYYIASDEFGFKRDYYVNVIDNYCIEGFFDTETTEQLDAFYQEHTSLSKEALQQLSSIVSQRGKFKLVISRNKKKSDKIKNTLNKYFYIKK